MQKNTIITWLSIIVIVLLAIYFWQMTRPQSQTNQPVACTADAMQCPDGSYVGRTGPMCQFSPCPVTATSTPVTNGDVTVGVGQTSKIGALAVTLNKFVQDSRCPIDVQCIQAGAVTVNVTLADATKTETRNLASDEVPYVFDRYYKISITGIAPARMSKVQIPANSYVITFHIEKVSVAIPTPPSMGVVTGFVSLSPTCPVERNPPDPNCAPKPYQTTVTIFSSTGKVITSAQTKSDGTYIVTIPFGDYIARVASTGVYPRCSDSIFTLQGATQSVDISCDTGIR